MELQVQELIDKIRKDGTQTAQEEASRIKAEAEKAAALIIETAKKDADALLAKAKTEADRLEESGKAALAQASRNLVLSLRDQVTLVLKSVIERETRAAFDPKTLEAAIPAVLASWKDSGTGDLAVLLNPDDLAKLESFFAKKLADELKAGLELKPFPNLKSGFRVSEKSGASYWDFSVDSLAELLAQYLNPVFAEIMKRAGAGN